MSNPALVIFGSQITKKPSVDLLHQIRQSLIEHPALSGFLKAIKDLPELQNSLQKHDSQFGNIDVADSLDIILKWIDANETSWIFETLPNSFLTPFTVIVHTVLYVQYLTDQTNSSTIGNVSNVPEDVEGFCTGFLTATAAALSDSTENFVSYACVSLRLALLVGAAVDLDGNTGGSSQEISSLAVRWSDGAGKAALDRFLQTREDVYISVISQENMVTITLPRTLITKATQELSDEGCIVRDFGLRGRFHSPALADSFESLVKFCDSYSSLQLPSAELILSPLRSNTDGKKISGDRLDKIALQSLLLEKADWNTTITDAATDFRSKGYSNVIIVGVASYLPRPLAQKLDLQTFRLGAATISESNSTATPSPVSLSGTQTPSSEFTTSELGSRYSAGAVAVIGMGCKFPGADSPEEFWDLIQGGRSMVEELPESRFSTRNLRRSQGSDRRFYGNFIKDPESFDNRFFKKSSREAAQMDPQQRILLEVAYQAMESAGYFGNISELDDNIGCFVGVCGSDYNDNVASHPPTAFSSLGTLRAFLSGKISHYFGWSGPSITYDTACSSSAVAIDAACKSIIAGDCTQAVAGGANVLTSANFYQNLMAGGFLSPTGATKSFDASADGYCRGEGVGLVVLKQLKSAIADGDNIMGVISATAVNQNSNTVPITVPFSASQIDLYQKVSRLAKIDPSEVTFVEAHGTGTPVGDPIECESIREVFAGADRKEKLYLGSVKANIGHTESTSGVAGLIKALLMIRKRKIPVQANFNTLNPKIPALGPDQMAIPRRTFDWDAKFLAACVNNYGAAGSNAAMIVCEPPLSSLKIFSNNTSSPSVDEYPFTIAAESQSSLLEYCNKLLVSLKRIESGGQNTSLLRDLAFALSARRNPRHSIKFNCTAKSLPELQIELTQYLEKNRSVQQVTKPSKRKPVVLTFGGQVGRNVGLPPDVYKNSRVLQQNLATCEALGQKTGLPSLFPGIFNTDPVEDVVCLHYYLFVAQYSFAKTWLACGLDVDAIIGHSFGQLTALCVTGVLSLEECLKLVVGRAKLMKKLWGSERGVMVSVEADGQTIDDLVTSVNSQRPDDAVEVACYNSATSHVLVGSESAMGGLENLLDTKKRASSSLRWKRLNVLYGFHSAFAEPLVPALLELAKSLNYQTPQLPLETCSKKETWVEITPDLVANHTRDPVYFGDAVARIESRLGACSWIEAGFNSSVMSMVRRAVQNTKEHDFHAFNFTNSTGWSSLIKMTIGYWDAGQYAQFWPFNYAQKNDYEPVDIPSYQFDKSRHWIDWIDYAKLPAAEPTPTVVPAAEPEVPAVFMTTVESSDTESKIVFDPSFDEYRLFVHGHRVLNEPLCPAPLYMELAVRGAKECCMDLGQIAISVEELKIMSPLGLATDRLLVLKLSRSDKTSLTWNFEFHSANRQPITSGISGDLSHASGVVTLAGPRSQTVLSECERYGRLVEFGRVQQLIADEDAESMQGSLIYKVFSKVVHYEPYYKGVRSVAAKGNEVLGTVRIPQVTNTTFIETECQPLLLDNFVQVAGLHVNSLNECGENEVFVCTMVDRVQLTSAFTTNEPVTRTWTVYSTYSHVNEKLVVNDIFVFDTETKKLAIYILGAQFTKVAMRSLARVLASANTREETPKIVRLEAPAMAPTLSTATTRVSDDTAIFNPGKGKAAVFDKEQMTFEAPAVQRSQSTQSAPTDGLLYHVRSLISKITDVDITDIVHETTPDVLGIDSLMITEVLSEIRQTFGVEIPQAEFVEMENFGAMYEYLKPRVKSSDLDIDFDAPGTPETEYISDGTGDKDDNSSVTSVEVDDAVGDKNLLQLGAILQEHLDTDITMTEDVNLADAGMDSLLCMEVISDIQKAFNIAIDGNNITNDTTFGELAQMVFPDRPSMQQMSKAPEKTRQSSDKSRKVLPSTNDSKKGGSLDASKAFLKISRDYDKYAAKTGFSGFWTNVYPDQAKLVLAYVVEAFFYYDIDLSTMDVGAKVPNIEALPKHSLLVQQLYNILEDASLIQTRGTERFRTNKVIDTTPSTELKDKIIRDFPKHAQEHELLHITGSQLGPCLKGTEDALMLLFRPAQNRKLLEDVYQKGPMYEAVTEQLASFFEEAFKTAEKGEIFEILELGGGTGGTTKYLVKHLMELGISFRYTFTDLGSSLVGAAKRKFKDNPHMSFAVVDITKEPAQEHLEKYHAILSTNCIHATPDLAHSTSNMRKMLRTDGFISLVEFTRNMFWFDLVFGLLDGWWGFTDGRPHVLASEFFWERSLLSAGFEAVAWTGAESEESNTLRIITAYRQPIKLEAQSPVDTNRTISEETVLYKQVGSLSLFADIYYPAPPVSGARRPIALMIHGGGHCMLSRKDVRPEQTQQLLSKGFIPVSIDYRLCPEVDVQNGAMEDMRDAIQWARHQLPLTQLSRHDILFDAETVVVVGWSTGGTLAMSSAWTTVDSGLAAPSAIYAFYCPTDYEDMCWQEPNYPGNDKQAANAEYDLLEGVYEGPITAYNVPPSQGAVGGWQAPCDPRSRIVLHNNWHGQVLPTILDGLPTKTKASADPAFIQDRAPKQRPQPSLDRIQAISPLAQIRSGKYKVPTFLLHSGNDDLIPDAQVRRTYAALLEKGLSSSKMIVVDGVPHLFDLYRRFNKGKAAQAVQEGYDWLAEQAGLA